MDIVTDTNVFLAVSLNEPERGRIVQLTTGASICAPEILPYEIGNALSAMVKRSKLTESQALMAEKAASLIAVRLVSVDIHASLELATSRNIYAYDAYFLHCARMYALPLLTLDKRMKQIAIDLGIPVLE